MESFESDLKQMLRNEITDKGSAPCVSFGLFGFFVLFNKLGCKEFAPLMVALSVAVIIISALRFMLIKKIKTQSTSTKNQWELLKFYIWLNGLCWGAIFTAGAVEHKFAGVYYILLMIIMFGFTSASLITISANLGLFVSFQLLLLGPQILIVTYDIFHENAYHMEPMIFAYAMYLFYQFYQVKDYRHKVIQNFKVELKLRETNAHLMQIQEENIQQAAKLIHTSRLAALGEMAAGVAHEVNNPLAIISASLQQLERKIVKKEFDDVEALKTHTARAVNSIQRITKIITGLRLLSQQSDNQPKEKVSLREIINETLGFCGEMLKARYVELRIDEIPEVMIECNPIQISQVMINLIKNAEDALKVETDRNELWVKISFEKNDSNVIINVSNGGAKITKVNQEKLFQPFFTTKAVGQGTGLGLSISLGIVREHGGDLFFNEIEKQTTFTISLPII
jgi:signal transduction histidine kinase